jgi:ubiquinone/menaquinone biosynthesis C-methylase UbiE
MAQAPPALERALALLDPAVRPKTLDAPRGYLDLVGDRPPPPTGAAQALMLTRLLPAVYERWWRPAWARVVRGAGGLAGGMAEERRIARLLLGLTPGDGVLDVACGPGNFTREFAAVVGPGGLAVGIDASSTMLARAVRDTPGGVVAYVRGDAVRLPFRDRSFDAVCCFAALHLFAEPSAALDHMARVLTPGGRVAIFTTCRMRGAPLRAVDAMVGIQSGMRMFERDEIVTALEERGFEDVTQRVGGFTQFVGARRR